MAASSNDDATPSTGPTLPAEGSRAAADERTVPAGLAAEVSSSFAEVPTQYYEMGAELARGGMGRITYAHDTRADRPVAIKEILDERVDCFGESERDALVARFRREALVTAGLQHPSIVPVYEVGSFDGRPFFAMKMVNGEHLGVVIARCETLDHRLRLLPKVTAIAEAMAYAHRKQIVHRDLKPGNVLVGAFGETVVIDWGLAKRLGGDEDAGLPSKPLQKPLQTAAGAVFGTPEYMPLEQALGQKVDERADVYALGAILYHVLAGRPPYEPRAGCSDPLADVLLQLQDGPPPRLEELAPDVPRDLISIVERAMARDSRARYRNASGLAEDLRKFEAGKLVEVHEYSILELIARWAGKYRAAVATAVVGLAVVATLGVFAVQRIAQERDDASKGRDQALKVLVEAARESALRDDWISAINYLERATRLGARAERPVVRSLASTALRMLDGQIADLGPGISRAQFSADSTRLLTESATGQARLWDAGTGALITDLNRDAAQIRRARFAPGKTDVVTCDDRGLIRVWPAGEDSPGGSFAALGAPCLDLRFSPDGKLVATASARGGLQVRAWPSGELVLDHAEGPALSSVWLTGTVVMGANTKDYLIAIALGSGEILGIVPAHESPLRFDPIISDDGSSFLRPVGSHKFEVWTAAKGKQPERIQSHGYWAAAAISPGGKLAAIATERRDIQIWNTQTTTLEAVLTGHRRSATALSFSADGKYLVSGSLDFSVRVWDLETRRLRSVFIGLRGRPVAAALSPDGSRLVASDNESTILWDADYDLRFRLPTDGRSQGVAAAAGDRIVVWTDRGVMVLEAETGERVFRLGETNSPVSVSVSPDGELLATSSGVYEVRTGRKRLGLRVPNDLAKVFSPEGGLLAYSTDTSVEIVDTETGELMAKRVIKEIPLIVEFPTRHTVVIRDGGGALLRWNWRADRFEDWLPGPRHRSLVRSPDNSRIFVAGTLRDVGTDRVLFDETARLRPSEWVQVAAFSSDSTKLAFGTLHGRVLVLDARTGGEIWATDLHEKGSSCVEFSPDGTRLLHCGKQISIREADTGALIWRSVPGPDRYGGRYARWSPAGDAIMAASATELKVYDVSLRRESPRELGEMLRARMPAGVLDELRGYVDLE